MSSDTDRELFRLRQERDATENLIRVLETQKEEIVSLRLQRGKLIEETRDLNAMVNHLQAGAPAQLDNSAALRAEIAHLATVRNTQADRIRKQGERLAELGAESESRRREIADLRRVLQSCAAENREQSRTLDKQARKIAALEDGWQRGKSGVTRHQVESIIAACAQRGKEREFLVIDEAGPYPEGLL